VTLAEFTLAAIMSLPGTSAPQDRPRLEELAGAIAEVVEDQAMFADWVPGVAEPLPFDGPRADEATVLALVSLAYGESRFAAEVGDCRRIGSDFPSVGYFQLYGWWAFGPYTRTELCSSPERSAKRALWVFSQHGARCSTSAAAFRGYASGDCGRDSKAARAHCARWERLSRTAGITVSCNNRHAQGPP
jgi:hypothetical protein